MEARQSGHRKAKRTLNACIPCRQSKIKCSGDDPCGNCQRRLVPCRFAEEDDKMLVSRRYLHNLQRQLRELQQVEQTRTSIDHVSPFVHVQDEAPPVPPNHKAYNIWTSPFQVPSSVVSKPTQNRRGWIWLAPSSIYSFYARLGLLMTEKLGLERPEICDEEVYPFMWCPRVVNETPDISGLPSIDHALYLFSTVKFNFNQIYRLFDEEVFVNHVKEFYYGNGVKKATKCPLWFVQFLLLLAFGTAFTCRSNDPKSPPGASYFYRAMALMPELTCIWTHGVAAIEILALAGLYMYCMEHVKAAHLYVGQAIRIAMMEGLHTQLPEDQLGPQAVGQCRNLWWTLYIMDRQISSSIGIPVIAQDIDISTLMTPLSTASQDQATLCLQVKLWQLMSHILTTIYKTERTQLGSFLEMTRCVLQSLAGHAQEIEETIHHKFRTSVDRLPKGTRTVTLMYHQCVIFATRPLLLSILKERLDKLNEPDEDWQSLLSWTAPLISTGIKSASKMLQILSQEGNLLEVFLLNDLEFVYGSTLFLTMATALFPLESEGHSYRRQAHALLDDMINKGNNLVEGHKRELLYLERLFDEFTERVERQGIQTLTLGDLEVTTRGTHIFANGYSQEAPLDAGGSSDSTMISEPEHVVRLTSEPTTNLELMESMGISSYEFLSLVDEMGTQDALFQDLHHEGCN